jgi:hypothetical protein
MRGWKLVDGRFKKKEELHYLKKDLMSLLEVLDKFLH